MFIVASEEDVKIAVFISTERRRNIVPSYIAASEEDVKIAVFISTERQRNIVPSYIHMPAT